MTLTKVGSDYTFRAFGRRWQIGSDERFGDDHRPGWRVGFMRASCGGFEAISGLWLRTPRRVRFVFVADSFRPGFGGLPVDIARKPDETKREHLDRLGGRIYRAEGHW